jgi:hypothetical protein
MTRRDTSLLAYQQIQPQLGKQQKKALGYVKAFPDHTYGELAKISGMGESFRKRASELEHQNLIKSSEKRVCKESGKLCHVWRLA